MKKFTLIELLIVIAIIGVLSSIMLPSLSKAREKGLNAVCLSNLKQSMMHALIYQQDNGGHHYMKRTGPSGHGWAGIIEKDGGIEVGDKSVYCPKSYTYTETVNSWQYSVFAYGGNIEAMYKSTVWGQRPWFKYVNDGEGNYYLNTAAVEKASDFIFAADTLSTYVLEDVGEYRNSNSFYDGLGWARIWTVHNPYKKANTVFLDGHVASTTVPDIRTLTKSSVSFDYD